MVVWNVRFLVLRRWGLLQHGWCWPIRRRGGLVLPCHPGILHEHLRPFAATPGEIVEEVFPADAVCAGWGIDFRLAAFDETGQIVHSILRFRIHSMQDGGAEYQLGSGAWIVGQFENDKSEW
jgi:hypothetical protein